MSPRTHRSIRTDSPVPSTTMCRAHGRVPRQDPTGGRVHPPGTQVGGTIGALALAREAEGQVRPGAGHDGAEGVVVAATIHRSRWRRGRHDAAQSVTVQELGRRCGGSRHPVGPEGRPGKRSDEHTSELQSLMRTSYADLFLKTKK